MLVQFAKMNGAGNDFVLLDNRDRKITIQPDNVVRLCDRHRGVGADGVIVWVPCHSGKADWAWEFFNSDGSTGEMCGNGARCFARFVQSRTGQRELTFETEAGVIQARMNGELVTVNLTEPGRLRLNEQVPLARGRQAIHSLNTGVPHAVIFVPDADRAMLEQLGPEIRRHAHFGPKGTNVNFVQVLGPQRIKVRTFERGVEGETLACGTGVTASALVASRIHGFASPVNVLVKAGDELSVSFKDAGEGFTDVQLTGPAEFVFKGEIDV